MSILPKFSLIVAKSRNNVIGADGDLPWRLSSDLKFFKKTTIGKPVLMGRVTWESLPFPLPGRPNLVLTRDRYYTAKGAEVFRDPMDMIGRGYELAGSIGANEIMLIGGANLYTSLLKYCDRMYISHINVELSGDAYFPEFPAKDWHVVHQEQVLQSKSDQYSFEINIYERISPDESLG